MDNKILKLAVRAIISGLTAGLIVALLLYVISALLPAVHINASFWGTIVGILTAVYVFVTGRDVV